MFDGMERNFNWEQDGTQMYTALLTTAVCLQALNILRGPKIRVNSNTLGFKFGYKVKYQFRTRFAKMAVGKEKFSPIVEGGVQFICI